MVPYAYLNADGQLTTGKIISYLCVNYHGQTRCGRAWSGFLNAFIRAKLSSLSTAVGSKAKETPTHVACGDCNETVHCGPNFSIPAFIFGSFAYCRITKIRAFFCLMKLISDFVNSIKKFNSNNAFLLKIRVTYQ